MCLIAWRARLDSEIKSTISARVYWGCGSLHLMTERQAWKKAYHVCVRVEPSGNVCAMGMQLLNHRLKSSPEPRSQIAAAAIIGCQL
eukprot:2043777-Rhodomonas_salina.2